MSQGDSSPIQRQPIPPQEFGTSPVSNLLQNDDYIQWYFHGARDLLIVLHPDFSVVAYNHQAEEVIAVLLGKSIQRGDSILNFTPVSSLEAFQQQLREVLNGSTITIERPIQSTGGETFWFAIKMSPAHDVTGSVVGVLLMGYDISEKKQLEQEREQARKNFEDFYEYAPVGYQSFNHQGIILQVNATQCDMLGRDKAEMFGQFFGDFLTPASRAVFEQHLITLKKVDEDRCELECSGFHDFALWVELSTTVRSRNNNEQSYETRSILRDITALKIQQQRLKASEARFRDLIEGSMQGMVVHREFRPLFANEKFAEIYGFTSVSEVLDLPDLLSLMPPQLQYETHHIWDALSHRDIGDVIVSRVENSRKNGAQIWVDMIQRVVLWDNNVAIQVNVVDATNRHKAEQALLKTQVDLYEAQRIAQIGSFETSFETKLTKLSPIMYDILGVEDTIEMSIERALELIHPDDVEKVTEIITSSLQFHQDFHCDFRIIRSDGDLLWVSCHGRIVTNRRRIPIQMIGTLQNITLRKQFEESLRVAKWVADQANEAKSMFIANVSHEIRTPMNAILGFAELLRDYTHEPTGKEYLQSIVTSGGILLELINDVLDFSKIETGRMDLVYHPVDLLRLIEDLRRMFMALTLEKGLEFRVIIGEAVPRFVLLDGNRIRQILLNILSNAVKFTESGFIHVFIKSDKTAFEQPDRQEIRITVQDSGIGIPDNQQEAIFEAFRQQDNQSTRKFGGSGLGLTISRRLAEMMNGTLTVQSDEGLGSTFTLLLFHVKIVQDGTLILPEQMVKWDKEQQTIPELTTLPENSGKDYLPEVPTTLSMIAQARKEELREILTNDVFLQWKSLSGGGIQTREVIRFGEYLADIGKEFDVVSLAQYGMVLVAQTQTFNIRHLDVTIKSFPDFFYSLLQLIENS